MKCAVCESMVFYQIKVMPHPRRDYGVSILEPVALRSTFKSWSMVR
jgi:hypothetical protein